jgi:hypothetical protein
MGSYRLRRHRHRSLMGSSSFLSAGSIVAGFLAVWVRIAKVSEYYNPLRATYLAYTGVENV